MSFKECIHFYSYSQSKYDRQVTIVLISINTYVLRSFELHMNGVIGSVLYSVWLHSLKIVFLQFNNQKFIKEKIYSAITNGLLIQSCDKHFCTILFVHHMCSFFPDEYQDVKFLTHNLHVCLSWEADEELSRVVGLFYLTTTIIVWSPFVIHHHHNLWLSVFWIWDTVFGVRKYIVVGNKLHFLHTIYICELTGICIPSFTKFLVNLFGII